MGMTIFYTRVYFIESFVIPIRYGGRGHVLSYLILVILDGKKTR